MLFLADFFRNLARFGILLLSFGMIGIIVFNVQLKYGNSIYYLFLSLPDTLPYFLLLFALFIAWKYELFGGLLLFMLGLGSYYYLDLESLNIDTMIVFGVILFAVFFILSWAIRSIRNLTYA